MLCETISSYQLRDKDIILSPFSLDALLMYHRLKQDGVRVSAFFDRSSYLWNKQYDDVPILCPYNRSSKEGYVIICSQLHYDDIKSKMLNLGYDDESLPSMAYIRTISDDYIASNDIDEACFSEISPYWAYEAKVKIKELRMFAGMDEARRNSAITLPNFSLAVTQRCTLRCNGCAGLNHYSHNLRDIDFEEVKLGFDLAFEKIDYVGRLDVCGGETFLYKCLGNILQHVYNSPAFAKGKIGYINIITNGTLIPDDNLIEVLKNTKTKIMISNYRELSKRRDDLVDLFSRKGLSYEILNHTDWRYISQPLSAPSDPVKKRGECMTPCPMTKGTKFYVCAFLANAPDFGIITDDKQNRIDMLSNDFTNEKIRCYLRGTMIPPGCAFCSGLSKNDLEGDCRIPVAQQLDAPIEYKPIHVNT